MSTHRQTSLIVVVSSVFLVGGLWGPVAATINFTIAIIEHPVWLLAGFMLGTIMAVICAPLVSGLTLRKNRKNALYWIYGITTFLICLWSIVVHHPYVLMGLSGLSFIAIVFFTWLWLPRVWTEKDRCARCGYDLRGSTHSSVCPECGTSTEHDVQKRIVHTPTRGAKTVLASAIVFACTSIAACLIEYHIQHSPMNFDPRLWRDYPKSYYRQAMAESFVENDDLIGLSREELIAKLGQPDGDVDIYRLPRDLEIPIRYNSKGHAASIGSQNESPISDEFREEYGQQIVGKPREFVRQLLGHLEMKRSTLVYIIEFSDHHLNFGRWRNLRNPLVSGSVFVWLDVRLRGGIVEEVGISSV